MFKLNYSTFSHEASQSGHDCSQRTRTCSSILNQGGGGRIDLKEKRSTEAEDKSGKSHKSVSIKSASKFD